MEWNWLPDGSGIIAPGAADVYLVTEDMNSHGSDVSAVRLSRWTARPNPSAVEVATEIMRNVIILPLGRGPGRPAGNPEVRALLDMAKSYAERYEAGTPLEGYPAWRRPLPAWTGGSDACPHC
jgi:hypothetical protein